MDPRQIIELCGMEEALCRLIGLYCMRPAPEKEIADWFSQVDFEALRPEVSCMAAAVAAANDYKGAPPELVPRLRGITRYVYALNSGMTAGLCGLGKRFHEAGIPAILLGETAVHLGYPNPPHRHIWQTQLRVSEADFPRAVELAADVGFSIQQTPYSATARLANTQCVLIRKGVGLAGQTTTLTTGGAVFLLPGREELLADLAQAVVYLLFGAKPGAKLIPWFMDLHCVITADPDWKTAAAVAAARGIAHHVRLALELYNSLTPNVLTEDVMNLFGTHAAASELAQLLLKCQNIKPGGSKLERLWLSSRIKGGRSLLRALGVFLNRLCRVALRKLTPGN